jgi:hypothetical protein
MFDRYIEQARKPVGYRRALIILSLVAHSVVGLFLFAMTLFEVEEIRPPPRMVTFFNVIPPPPPPPLPAFGRHHDDAHKHEQAMRRTVPKVVVQQAIVQPAEVKPPEPKPAAEEKDEDDDEPEGDPDGVAGGSAEGVADGRVGGVAGGQVTPGAAQPVVAKPPPKMVASFVFDRERLQYPNPQLPETFKRQHALQTLRGMYRICVDMDGSIEKMETVSSISGMDRTIIEQVIATWRYKPQPVPVCTIRVFEFRIS